LAHVWEWDVTGASSLLVFYNSNCYLPAEELKELLIWRPANLHHLGGSRLDLSNRSCISSLKDFFMLLQCEDEAASLKQTKKKLELGFSALWKLSVVLGRHLS